MDATSHEENKIKQQLIANAFEVVFGQEKKRTPSQKLALEYLKEGCEDESNSSYKFGGGQDGITIIAAGIHRDGAKSLLRIINRQLLKAAELRQKPKEAAKVKR